MFFMDEVKGKYVFSKDKDRPGALTAWEIIDKFEDHCGEYFVIKNIISGERKCCFTYYDLKIWDTSDPINYPLNEVQDGLAEIQDFNDILYYKRDFEEDEEPYGWLSPTAEFFHCKCGNHIMIARVVLRSSEAMLEDRGWVKVLYDYFLMGRCYLTPEQAHWLREHHFDEEEIESCCNF